MSARGLRIGSGGLAVLLVAVLLPAASASGQTGLPVPGLDDQTPETPVPAWNECVQNIAAPGPSGEIYGPTAVNAQSANQRMAAAVNDAGTVTVLRWPRPSFYDHVKYRTASRDAPRLGALPNEGMFLGLAVTTPAEGTRTVWLRDLPATQRHPDGGSDLIETRYRADELGLRVVVRDVVAPDRDVLRRRVVVDRRPGSPVTDVRLIAFENLNLAVGRLPYLPVTDWCLEELNGDRAIYDPARDAIIHTRSGIDPATGEPSRAAVAMAFAGGSDGHQVGGDAHEGTALPLGRLPGPTRDASEDAADGRLSGGGAYTGQTTGALAADLDLSRGPARRTLLIAAAPDTDGVADLLAAARRRPFRRTAAAKAAWFDRLLDDAPMPATDDPAVLALAHRALVTLASVYDRRSGAVVASIATQSPYGEDWIRDGAFFNHVLDLIGRHDWVAERTRWYASLQSGAPGRGRLGVDNPVGANPLVETTQQALVPSGNWAMNYYADGVPGGPIPWEIDETGYGLWAFWDHYAATGDTEQLRAVYPAVRRAADFLTGCVDPGTGLQCPAWEDDNPQPRRTIHGAGPVWLGLDSAVRAAEVLGEQADAVRWRTRREQLRAAIETELRTGGVYGDGNGVVVWPVCFHDYDDERFADRQYEAIWRRIAPTFDEPRPGGPQRGLYEVKGLLALAKATKGRPAWTARVRRGLRWIATEHAEPGTHVMGEEWLQRDGEIISAVSQPHVWEQVLFYLAALEAWPPAGAGGGQHRDCGGTIAALRGGADRG